MRLDRPAIPPPDRYETIAAPITVDVTYKRMVKVGEFARVLMRFEPTLRGRGYSFHVALEGDEVPERFLPGIEAGLESSRRRGPKAGYPVSDFTATLIGGAHHDLDSSEVAFLNAAEMAFVELREKGEFIVVEGPDFRPPAPEPEEAPRYSDNVIPFPKRP
jgi:elongation factor G